MNSEMTGAGRSPPECVALDAPDQKDGWIGVSPFVIPCVTWSLYSFLRPPDDHWRTVLTEIAAGVDADTTDAMAGPVSGARVGSSALPATLAARLDDRDTGRLPEPNEPVDLCVRTVGQAAR